MCGWCATFTFILITYVLRGVVERVRTGWLEGGGGIEGGEKGGDGFGKERGGEEERDRVERD